MNSIRCGLALAVAILPLAAAAQDAIKPEGLNTIIAGRPYSPYADRAFPTNVYFGEARAQTETKTCPADPASPCLAEDAVPGEAAHAPDAATMQTAA